MMLDDDTYVKVSQVLKVGVPDALVEETEHAVKVRVGGLPGLLLEVGAPVVEVKVVQPGKAVAGQGLQGSKEEQKVLDEINNADSKAGLEGRSLDIIMASGSVAA